MSPRYPHPLWIVPRLAQHDPKRVIHRLSPALRRLFFSSLRRRFRGCRREVLSATKEDGSGREPAVSGRGTQGGVPSGGQECPVEVAEGVLAGHGADLEGQGVASCAGDDQGDSDTQRVVRGGGEDPRSDGVGEAGGGSESGREDRAEQGSRGGWKGVFPHGQDGQGDAQGGDGFPGRPEAGRGVARHRPGRAQEADRGTIVVRRGEAVHHDQRHHDAGTV